MKPLPVLVLLREPEAEGILGAFERDARIALLTTRALTPDWIAFAQRVGGIVVATTKDPTSALGYALTSSIRTTLIVAAQLASREDIEELKQLGASLLINLPPTSAQIDRMLQLLSQSQTISVVEAGGLFLDTIELTARYRDKTVRLSQRECALLHSLMRDRGAVSSDDLRLIVWGERARHQSSNNLEFYVHQLRIKLKRLGLESAITTIRNFGYELRSSDEQHRHPHPST